ncbi:MAG: response regulator transcription factor [Candidatus Sericytochromatia bacterium]|nr:response regulator transcription factor [Candidatus Sericytochromatia bacterium]
MARILLVEDDPNIQSVVTSTLRREGHEVCVSTSGPEALALTDLASFEMAILDVMLPGMSGYDVAVSLRTHGDFPILMLTGLASDQDIIRGLAHGADEYVTKPFSPVVLAARVKANLRRTSRDTGEASPGTDLNITIGGLNLDTKQWSATLDGDELVLSAREFKLLHFLISHRNQVMGRDRIITAVWPADYDGSDRVVDVSICRLRRQVLDRKDCPVTVKPVHGIGYKLIVKAGPAGVA